MILGAESGDVNGLAIGVALAASIGLIVLNGVYVAYEFAVLAARRSSFEDEGRRSRVNAAARASLSDVSMQLAGAQLGITMASLALGRISEPALEVVIELLIGDAVAPDTARYIGIGVSLGVFTVLHLIFGEMVPKNIALTAPDATLRWLVVPYRLYLFLFSPVVRLLNGIANVCCRLVGIQPRDELSSVRTATELAAIVAHSSAGGAIKADDAEILQGVLDFAQRPVGDIATALADQPSVNLGATVGQLERAVASGAGGRVLVIDPRRSAPIGYLHVRDLLELNPEHRWTPVPSGLVRNMAVVDADWSLVDVLVQLRRLRRPLALVNAGEDPVGVVSQEQVVRALVQRRPIHLPGHLPGHADPTASARLADPGSAVADPPTVDAG
ncbi:MAG: CNNM domain-containing protein [Actinomycetota bacterium]